MKAADILNGFHAWTRLVGMKMSASNPYSLMKYARLVFEEYELIERRRSGLVHRITGTEPGSNAEIKHGTNEFEQYVSEFSEMAEVEVSVPTFGNSLEAVLSWIPDDEKFSAQELAVLEPFFGGDDGASTN